jgi:hypothetical protein
LAAHLSQFRQSSRFKEEVALKKTRNSIPLTEINYCSTLLEDAVRFTLKSATIECSVGQAVAHSPVVRERLSVDACAHTFTFMDVSVIDSAQRLLSAETVSNVSPRTSLRRQLCTPGLERALLGIDHVDLRSIDLSILSVEALDNILAGASFSLPSEDNLLEQLLSLGEAYHSL